MRTSLAGTPGELLCRSYTTMLGYYNKPEATAETIDEDGWLHSGDLARLRPDGHVVFMGRLKDMLKVGGENVAPAEIEGRLRSSPASWTWRSSACTTIGSGRSPSDTCCASPAPSSMPMSWSAT